MSFLIASKIMYLSHYNLKTKPFLISTDPKFLWLGEKHKEALATLKYGTLDNKGFLLLTGDVGTGKTTLINALIESVGDGTIIATVPDPGLEKLDFFNFIAYAFKLKKRFDNKGAFLVHFSHFLHGIYKKDKSALLIIDEAQRLNQELLEEIRLLSNIEKQDKKLINIFFVGQKEFNDVLLDSRNRALRQRITLNYNIDPLTERETGKYIRHRLKIAGSEEDIFSSSAIREIVSFSKGNPRLINICCDHALLTGYVKGVKKIDAKIIRECAEELKIPGKVDKEKIQDVKGKIAKERVAASKGKPRFTKARYIAFITLFFSIVGAFVYFGEYVGPKKDLKPERSIQVAPVEKNVDLTQKEKKSVKTVEAKRPDDTAASKKILSEGEIKTAPPQTVEEQKAYQGASGENKITDNRETLELLYDKKYRVYFAFNSNELAEDAYEILDRLSAAMIQNPDISIIIKGYTDRTGYLNYNKKLSEFRANIVKGYFIGKGVAPSRIKTFGMGPVSLEENGKTRKELRSNRRVEIEFNRN